MSREKGKIRKQIINPGGIRFGARGLFKTSKTCNEEKKFPPFKYNNSHRTSGSHDPLLVTKVHLGNSHRTSGSHDPLVVHADRAPR